MFTDGGCLRGKKSDSALREWSHKVKEGRGWKMEMIICFEKLKFNIIKQDGQAI